jgi:hypothetical protein
MYRVGWPLWKQVSKFVPLVVKLDVQRDPVAQVLIVTSPDLPALVVEMPEQSTATELHNEVSQCLAMVLEHELHSPLKSKPFTTWSEMNLAA